MSKKLLLLSNSSTEGQSYLEFALDTISNFLGDLKNGVFIPYAAVTFTFDDYQLKVNDALSKKGIKLKSIHEFSDQKKALDNCDFIVVGGGNTFRLLERCYHFDILDTIKNKVEKGTPYIGWSAGANLAGPTIKTSNDMPIIKPPSFDALNLIQYQINPHYNNALPEGHKGETRDQRIEEFLAINSDKKVLAIPEGTFLTLENQKLQFFGQKNAFLMSHPWTKTEITNNQIV